MKEENVERMKVLDEKTVEVDKDANEDGDRDHCKLTRDIVHYVGKSQDQILT